MCFFFSMFETVELMFFFSAENLCFDPVFLMSLGFREVIFCCLGRA